MADKMEQEMYDKMFGTSKSASEIMSMAKPQPKAKENNPFVDGADLVANQRIYEPEGNTVIVDPDEVEESTSERQEPEEKEFSEENGTDKTGKEYEFKIRGKTIKKTLTPEEEFANIQKGLDYEMNMNKLDLDRQSFEKQKREIEDGMKNKPDDVTIEAGKFLLDLQKSHPEVVDKMQEVMNQELERKNNPSLGKTEEVMSQLSSLYDDENYKNLDLKPIKLMHEALQSEIEAGKRREDLLLKELKTIKSGLSENMEYVKGEKTFKEEQELKRKVTVLQDELAKVSEKYGVTIDPNSQEARDFVTMWTGSYGSKLDKFETAFVKAYGVKSEKQKAKNIETKEVREVIPKTMQRSPKDNSYVTKNSEEYNKMFGTRGVKKIKLIPR